MESIAYATVINDNRPGAHKCLLLVAEELPAASVGQRDCQQRDVYSFLFCNH